MPVILGGLTGTAKAPFPANIPSSSPATISLYIYGGSNQEDKTGKVSQFDVPVSVNASPLTNRASWIQPPYKPTTSLVLPPPQLKFFLPWVARQN